jgi:hypothetical protein
MGAVTMCDRAPMHQPAAACDLMLRSAQGGFRQSALCAIDEIRIECLGQTLPEARARRGIDRNYAHRDFSRFFVLVSTYLRSIAYEFETE